MSSIPTDNRVQFAPLDLAAAGWQSLSHYENFSVVTWFLPKHLHQHFYNVYAYCRISDDLGDEVGDPQQSLALLDAWEAELNATYLSLVDPAPQDIRQDVEKLQAEAPARNPITPRHPVFIALRE